MSTPQVANNSRKSNDRYERFLREVELISVGLKKCSASLDRERMMSLYAKAKRPKRILQDSYKVTSIGPNFFEASGSFIVSVRGSEDSEQFLAVSCEFEAHLHGPEPLSQNLVRRFVESEFQLILIPYARQFVSSITASMSIPPITIPLQTKNIGGDLESDVKTKESKRRHGKNK